MAANTQVFYCYVIENTGPVTVTRHTLVDDRLGPILTDFPFALGPGGSAFITATAVITETTLNTAVWSVGNGGPILATATDTATLNVTNVAPAVSTAVAPSPSEEGETVTASATFSDPAGAGDAPFTCTVDYDEGGGPAAGTVAAFLCTGADHAYGDDGSFSVTVCVTDDDGGTGCDSATHEVLNVPPAVEPPQPPGNIMRKTIHWSAGCQVS